jgi:UDP-glucose 4-epimerase
MQTVVIRPFNTYGPRSHHEGDAGELIPKSIVRSLGGEPVLLFGDGKQTRDFTYVEDVALALFKAGECDKAIGRTLNVGSGFEISVNEVGKKVLELTKSGSGIRNLDRRPGDVLRLYADASEFRSLTGWTPNIALDDGLRRTVDWFRARPEGAVVLLRQERGRNWE